MKAFILSHQFRCSCHVVTSAAAFSLIFQQIAIVRTETTIFQQEQDQLQLPQFIEEAQRSLNVDSRLSKGPWDLLLPWRLASNNNDDLYFSSSESEKHRNGQQNNNENAGFEAWNRENVGRLSYSKRNIDFASLSGTSCQPSDDHFLEYAKYAAGSSNFMTSTLTPEPRNNVDMKSATDVNSIFGGIPDCTSPSDDIRMPLSARAICPWKWSFNYTPFRIPSVIYEAVCSCAHRSKGKAYECEQITMKMKVLKLKKPTSAEEEGCSKYELKQIDVRIGCVAVLPGRNKSDAALSVKPTIRLATLDDVS